MSLQPQIRRILVPPAAVPSKLAPPALQLAAVTGLATHAGKRTPPLQQQQPTAGKKSGAAGDADGTSPSVVASPAASNSGSSSSGGMSSPAAATAAAAKPAVVLQRHVAQHPVQPLIAYVLENATSNNNNHNHAFNKVIVVQNSVSRHVTFALHWWDVAAMVYGETDPKKLPAAARSLGAILSLQFYDPAVVHWSRTTTTATATPANTGSSSSNDPAARPTRWQSLAVQTDKRVLLLNLRQGPASSVQTIYPTKVSTTVEASSSPSSSSSVHRLVQAHVCEKTIGAVPSSNVLGVSDRWLLCGCADGSMKCYDWVAGAVVKKIKGLGKGDYVTQLLSANPYTLAAHKPRRILAVTKNGLAYLMELELSGGSGATTAAMDIQTPTARFTVPHDITTIAATTSTAAATTAAATTGDGAATPMEHAAHSYDAHTDRFLWFVLSAKGPVLYIWNLKALPLPTATTTTTSKSLLLKPEPTLVVQFPVVSTASTGSSNSTSTTLSTPNKDDNKDAMGVFASSSQVVTVLSGLVHPAFCEDTVVSVTLTASGDLCLHGAVALAANTTSTVQATPCMGAHLKQLLVATVESLNDAPDHVVDNADFRVHGVTASPLQSPGTGTTLTVATNWGLVVLELPVYSNSAVHSRSVALASRYLHFGAGLGSLGKSTVTVHHSGVTYGSLDAALTANPIGRIEPKNPVLLYDSPPATHMPAEFYKRPFRLAPLLLQSPSGVYVCLFWPSEFRYEVMHTASLLQQVGQLRAGNASSAQRRNLVVASGTGVCDFGWVSDNDVFAILHAPDLQEQAIVQVPKQSEEAGSYNLMSPNLKMIGAGAMGVANLATSVTKTATNATLSATKLATSAAVNTTMTVTKGATNAANMTVGVTTKAIRSGAKGVTKGVKKSFGIFGGKKKKGAETEGSMRTTADDDDDDEEESNAAKTAAVLALQQGPSAADLEALRTPNAAATSPVRQRYVELKGLDAVESTSQSADLSGGAAAATCYSLGDMSLRGGNRNPPTVIFGGPVLCVASRSDEDKEGHAHFYARKNNTDAADRKAASYQSSGPTLPYPDLVAWDDDGRLCAIVVENRVAVYLSDEPMFELLGTVRIGSPLVPTAEISSVKFVHGALFCCTWNSVHCVLLGDLEGGICRLDTYLLASTNVPLLSETATEDDQYVSLAPIHVSLPLVQPSVLGYQSGSLIVSTLRGVYAIPLSSPLMRIGLLMGAGQIDRAAKWFDAVPNSDHEALAAFVERRGQPELALQLPGLSLETIVDVSMRHGYVHRLEDVVETYGVAGLRAIDMGRGVAPSIFGPELHVHSVIVCVGAYLLAHGRVELTRRLATECLRSGEQGKKDAFLLGTLLLPVDESDAMRLIQRAVGEHGRANEDWIMGEFVRNYVLAPGSQSERT